MDGSKAGWVEECSGCGETPGGLFGKGNTEMDGGGRNKGRKMEKYDQFYRRSNHSSFLSELQIKANGPDGLQASLNQYTSNPFTTANQHVQVNLGPCPLEFKQT